MRIAICDDEPIFAEDLAKQVRSICDPETLEIKIWESGESLISIYEKGDPQYDILFLDIKMKQLNGFQTAQKIQEMGYDPILIFVTNYVQYYREGYCYRALDYLTKPVGQDKLLQCFRSIQKLLDYHKGLLVTHRSEQHFIKMDTILYIEVCDGIITLHTNTGSYSHNGTLNSYKQRLEDFNFYLSTRSILVNLRYVKHVKKNEVILSNGTRLLLSRERHKGFQNRMCYYRKYKIDLAGSFM